ncbi:MAG TPA: YqhA family protein [Polyangia bacterium]
MNRVVASARYLALIGVAFGLVAALAAFGWGGYKTIALVLKLLRGDVDGMAVGLVQVMDGFLIAAGLLIFALGLYELFIGEMALPAWLVVRDLDALKGKLAGVIVMVMAVTFLERLENLESARGLLEAGVSVALVSAVLVWMAKKP